LTHITEQNFFLHVKGRRYNKGHIISMALDVPKRIFAVLCVNYGPYTWLQKHIF